MDEHFIQEDVIISTYNMEWLLWLIVILLTIFCVYVIYMMYKGESMRLLNLRFYAKVLFISVLFIIACLGLIFKVIIFELTMDSKDASLVWVLMVSLLFNIYTNACFSNLVKNNNNLIKVGMFGTLIYITLTGLGTMGFRIVFNIDLVIPFILNYKLFEFNTANGIRFMFYNVGVFLIIFSASLLLETKNRR